MEYLEDRITRLEKTLGASAKIVQQAKALEQQLDALLTQHNAQNLDFNTLKAITATRPLIGAPHDSPHTTTTSREAKIQIIEARAAEILSQTTNIVDLPIPQVDVMDVDNLALQLRQCVHEFDETTQRSIQMSRIYLENVNKDPPNRRKP